MSNSLMQQQAPVLKQTLALRGELLSVLSDEDLAYALPGNITLGEMCVELGELHRHYIESFKTFRFEMSYRHADRSVGIEALRAWYTELENELVATLEALSEDDLQKMVDRGHGLAFPVPVQFHVFREGLLIYYGKASLYLKALGKTPPPVFQAWIGW